MEAADFITLAGKLVALGAAGGRSSVSRAYYSAFHLAHSMLNELGCTVPASGASHAVVPDLLGACRHPDAKAAARLLSDLHHQRLTADYRLDRRNVEQTALAMLAVESALAIQKHLEHFQIDCEADPTVRTDLMQANETIKRARRLP